MWSPGGHHGHPHPTSPGCFVTTVCCSTKRGVCAGQPDPSRTHTGPQWARPGRAQPPEEASWCRRRTWAAPTPGQGKAAGAQPSSGRDTSQRVPGDQGGGSSKDPTFSGLKPCGPSWAPTVGKARSPPSQPLTMSAGHLQRARRSAKHTMQVTQAYEGCAVIAPLYRWEN